MEKVIHDMSILTVHLIVHSTLLIFPYLFAVLMFPARFSEFSATLLSALPLYMSVVNRCLTKEEQTRIVSPVLKLMIEELKRLDFTNKGALEPAQTVSCMLVFAAYRGL